MTDFYDVASQKGWSKDEQISVLLDYVTRQSSPEAFADYLEEQEGYDDGLLSFEVTALWPEGGSWAEHVRAQDAQQAEIAAKEIMAENSGIPFEDHQQRADFKATIDIVSCV